MSDKFLRRQTKQFKTTKLREVYCLNREFNLKFPSNQIKTSKYTLPSFFPKSLFLQFSRISNIYFLLIAILQCIPAISPLSPFSAITPLTIVISLSLLREFFEDRVRHKSDKRSNAQNALFFNEVTSDFENTTWGDVKVGELIRVKDHEVFPADILVIECSNIHGTCYIETSSLDGEKNLKPRSIPEELMRYWGEPIRFEAKLECSHPNSILNDFSGVLEIMNKKIKLKANNLMLRGSKLRNTKSVTGVVIYTGIDTKIMRNSEKSKEKRSHLDKKTNFMMIYVLFLQIAFCLVSVLGNFSWNYLNAEDHMYLQIEDNPEFSCFLSFFTYFLLNNTMIPISLIVSLDFVKLAQAYFITNDKDFGCGDNSDPSKAISVFSSGLNEELGQIEYIFSDKTGTLTCNQMEFKFALIGNRIYGDPSLKKAVTFQQSLKDGKLEEMLKLSGDKLNWKLAHGAGKKHDFIIKNEQQLTKEYMLALATCHECIVEEDFHRIHSYQVKFIFLICY